MLLNRTVVIGPSLPVILVYWRKIVVECGAATCRSDGCGMNLTTNGNGSLPRFRNLVGKGLTGLAPLAVLSENQCETLPLTTHY
jgi:hypothetical protein